MGWGFQGGDGGLTGGDGFGVLGRGSQGGADRGSNRGAMGRGSRGGVPHQGLPREQLEEAQQQAAVAQVAVEVGHAGRAARQVRVHPLGEGLLLHRLPLVWGGGGSKMRPPLYWGDPLPLGRPLSIGESPPPICEPPLYL